jgi:hypothetical protein
MERMTYEYQIFFAVCGIGIALVRYALYFRAIFAKKVVPHVFSWFVWGLLTSVVLVAQVVAGAGPSAWITGLMAAACFLVAIVGFFKNGTKYITTSDWVSFIGALLAVVLWLVTSNPLAAVIVATVADMLGYIPTYRKAYVKPFEESAGGFALASSRSVFALLALSSFNLTTVIHPLFVLIGDAIAALLIHIRQRQLRKP